MLYLALFCVEILLQLTHHIFTVLLLFCLFSAVCVWGQTSRWVLSAVSKLYRRLCVLLSSLAIPFNSPVDSVASVPSEPERDMIWFAHVKPGWRRHQWTCSSCIQHRLCDRALCGAVFFIIMLLPTPSRISDHYRPHIVKCMLHSCPLPRCICPVPPTPPKLLEFMPAH